MLKVDACYLLIVTLYKIDHCVTFLGVGYVRLDTSKRIIDRCVL